MYSVVGLGWGCFCGKRIGTGMKSPLSCPLLRFNTNEYRLMQVDQTQEAFFLSVHYWELIYGKIFSHINFRYVYNTIKKSENTNFK